MSSSGPYGCETVVQAAGPGLTLLGLAVIPFVYSLPQSFMVSELSSWMPSNHGYIVWNYRALGECVGFVNGLNQYVSTGFDMPLYPVVMGQYIKQMCKHTFGVHLPHYLVWGIKALFVLLAGILNLMNISVQGNASIIFSVIFMMPFFIGFFYSLPNTDFNVWVKGAPGGTVNWAIYVSTLIWLHTGRDVMGCVAGEAGFEPKDFIKCFILSILMDWVGYTLPLIGAFAVHPYDGSAWQNGYLITAYNDIIPGLQWFVIVGALFSLFSLYFMEFCAHVRMMWAISQKYIIISGDGQLFLKDEYKKHLEELAEGKKTETNETSRTDVSRSETDNVGSNLGASLSMGPASASSFTQDDGSKATMAEASFRVGTVKSNRYIRVQILPEWIGWEWERTGSPAIAVAIQTLINMVLVGLPFDNLLIISTVIGCFTYLTEFTAFVVLKYTEPNAMRPYTVPGGIKGAWAVTVTKVALVFAVFGMTIYDYPWMFLLCIVYDVFLIALFFFRRWLFPDTNPYVKIATKTKEDV